MRIIITENEKNQISSKHEEFDSDILFFLMRRIQVNEKSLTWGLPDSDSKPLKVIEYSFEGFPGYGFNTYQSRPYWTKQILELLEEVNLIPENWPGDLKKENQERQKIIKTVRKFIQTILTK